MVQRHKKPSLSGLSGFSGPSGLDLFNQTNETNQMNQTDQIRLSPSGLLLAGIAFRG
jgi:hypothetical protein